jgi:hypothetical protein
MAHPDQICYLNREPAAMLSGLVVALNGLPAKLVKAPAAQWAATVKSLASKGVKQAEIDDCEILPWLESETYGKTRSLTRKDVIDQVVRKQVTVKEVVLGSPQYQGYSHWAKLSPEQKVGACYSEVLFIANSEKANLEDRVEEIDFELEQFNFDYERLSREPEAVLRLEKERAAIMGDVPKAWDYSAPHFTSGVAGKHNKNLIAHGRELVFDDIFLVDEIQSDWGQRGRKTNWVGIPKGPFVTDTKLWSGLVMRRLMQRAALNPRVRRVAWIRGSMRNGGVIVNEDNLDEFYMKTVRSIVDKVIGKVGGKVRLENLRIGTHVMADVPMFEMTDEVRAELVKSQPLYSLSGIRAVPHEFDDARRAAFLGRAKHMLGSVKHVRLVNRLYDLVTGEQVAGRYFNRLAQVALNAEDPEFVLDHESMHFAMANLLPDHERQMLLREFAPGTPLNLRTRDALIRSNDRAAARQCDSAEEAAAHGFALWARGKLDVEASPVRGVFEELRVVLSDTVAWFRRTVLGHQCVNVQEVFTALEQGEFADASARPGRMRAADAERHLA